MEAAFGGARDEGGEEAQVDIEAALRNGTLPQVTGSIRSWTICRGYLNHEFLADQTRFEGNERPENDKLNTASKATAWVRPLMNVR